MSTSSSFADVIFSSSSTYYIILYRHADYIGYIAVLLIHVIYRPLSFTHHRYHRHGHGYSIAIITTLVRHQHIYSSLFSAYEYIYCHIIIMVAVTTYYGHVIVCRHLPSSRQQGFPTCYPYLPNNCQCLLLHATHTRRCYICYHHAHITIRHAIIIDELQHCWFVVII